ncbi:hypothetical protein J7K27_03940 [Candidatus Bathyarchaeota archaeon]|nr:hypothetical protein [Candidatus Bathyarchaeota archaeon]
MSYWELLEESARKKGFKLPGEKLPTLRDIFKIPTVEERKKHGSIVKPIVELSEIASYLTFGCQQGLSIKEATKIVKKLLKKYEEVCNLLGIKKDITTIINLNTAFTNWCNNPNSPTAQFLLVDALSRILEHVKENG